MTKAYEAGKAFGSVMQAVKFIDFSVSERNKIALVTMSWTAFEAYVADGNREYLRGDVVRVGTEKYLIQNDGKIDPANPPRIEGTQVQPSLCKLFRDSARYPWVREEFCLKGFERYYDDGDPGRTGWYRVISNVVDSATPPNALPQNWEKLPE